MLRAIEAARINHIVREAHIVLGSFDTKDVTPFIERFPKDKIVICDERQSVVWVKYINRRQFCVKRALYHSRGLCPIRGRG